MSSTFVTLVRKEHTEKLGEYDYGMDIAVEQIARAVSLPIDEVLEIKEQQS